MFHRLGFHIPRARRTFCTSLVTSFRFSLEVFAFLVCLTFVMSASKKSSRISRPPRKPMDDDYAWESLGALTADLAGMCEDLPSHVTCFPLSTDPPQPSLRPGTAPASLSALSDLTASVQAHAYAPGTLRNLRSHWKSYISFCSTFGLLPLPASPRTISSYAVFLACFTSSYQTILNKLNGVRLFHLFQSTPCTALGSFEVSLTKKGLKRVPGLATHQRHYHPRASPSIQVTPRHHHSSRRSPLVPLHRSLLLFSSEV